jgi:hypothetical protein
MSGDAPPIAGGHEPFRFRTAAALRKKAAALGVDLPFDEDLSPLLQPAVVGGARAGRIPLLDGRRDRR